MTAGTHAAEAQIRDALNKAGLPTAELFRAKHALDRLLAALSREQQRREQLEAALPRLLALLNAMCLDALESPLSEQHPEDGDTSALYAEARELFAALAAGDPAPPEQMD